MGVWLIRTTKHHYRVVAIQRNFWQGTVSGMHEKGCLAWTYGAGAPLLLLLPATKQRPAQRSTARRLGTKVNTRPVYTNKGLFYIAHSPAPPTHPPAHPHRRFRFCGQRASLANHVTEACLLAPTMTH